MQGCYACTDWNLFVNTSSDIDECTDVTLDYIQGDCRRFIPPPRELPNLKNPPGRSSNF